MIRLIHGSIPLFFFFFAIAVASEPVTSQEPDAVFTGHLDAITMGGFTPDGRSVVTVSFDQTAKLWDVASRSERQQYTQHTGPIYCLAISADGTTMVTGAQDNTVRIWDLPLESPLRVIPDQQQGFSAVALSPTGDSLLSASVAHAVQLHSSSKSEQPPNTRKGHTADVLSVAYRNDGTTFASSDSAGRTILWNPYLEEPQGEVIGHDGPVSQIGFVSNNQQLLTTGSDGVLRVWQSMPALPKSVSIGNAPLIDWAVNASQSQAACFAEGGRAFLMNLVSGEVSIEYPKLEFKASATAHAANNSWVCIADETGTAHLLNYNDGAPRGSLACHQARMNDVAIHADSARFATCAQDGTVRLWAQPTPSEVAQQPLFQWQTDAGMAATCIAFTPDQLHLLCGTANGKIRQWNISNGEPVRSIDAHDGAIQDIKISPNGQVFGSIGDDHSLRIWNLSDGAPLQKMLHVPNIRRFAFSPDSSRVAVGCEDGVVRVWDRSTGLLLQSLAGHTAAIVTVGYFGDGQTIASTSTDNTLRLAKPSIINTWPLYDHPIRSMALYAGGAQVLSCDDRKVMLSNVANGTEVRPYRVREPQPATAADAAPPEATYQAFVPTVVAARSDNQRVAAGTESGNVLVWNINDAEKPLLTLNVKSPVIAIAFSRDNLKLAVATSAPAVYIFGPSTPGTQPASELVQHQEIPVAAAVSQLAFASDNQSFWVSLSSGQIQQWNYASVAQRRQMSHGGPVYGVAISRNGKLAISCSTDQTVRVWDTTTGQQKSHLNGHVGAVHSVAMSHDETFAVTSGADGTLRLWDVGGGRQLKQLTKFSDTMYSLAIHPHGNLVAAAGADRKIHLLDMITGEERQTLAGHSDYVHCVAFDPSGDRLLSYGYAGYLKIWNVTDGKLLHESRVGKVGNYAQFSPDGKSILLSNGDGTARIVAMPEQMDTPK